jgi:hypothetical protein
MEATLKRLVANMDGEVLRALVMRLITDGSVNTELEIAAILGVQAPSLTAEQYDRMTAAERNQ